MTIKISTGQNEVTIGDEYQLIYEKAKENSPAGVEDLLSLYRKSQEIYILQQTIDFPTPQTSASSTSC